MLRRPWGGVLIAIGGLLLVVFIPAALLGFIPFLRGAASHPSDAQLLRSFQRHRVELDQLIGMFEADENLGRVGEDFTRPDDPETIGVSSHRIQQYRHLCASVGARACIEGYNHDASGNLTAEKNPIWIHVSTQGLS